MFLEGQENEDNPAIYEVGQMIFDSIQQSVNKTNGGIQMNTSAKNY